MNISDFTDQELETIGWLMGSTWDVIGMDVLQGVAICEGKRRSQVSIPPDEVIEVVLDADHIECHAAPYGEDAKLMKKFRQLSYEDQIKFAERVFTETSYGM